MAASLTEPASALKIFLAHCRLRRYPAKCTIVYAGDKSESLYYVIQGGLSVQIEEENGREMIVAYLKEGDFFGEMGLFDATNRSAVIKAKTDCQIAELSYAKFYELALLYPALLFALEAQMARRLRATTRKVLDLAFLDVAGRIASILVELSRSPGAVAHPRGIQISVTRQEIALMVGCSREMVGRVLKAMEDRNLILARGKTLVICGLTEADEQDSKGHIDQ